MEMTESDSAGAGEPMRLMQRLQRLAWKERRQAKKEWRRRRESRRQRAELLQRMERLGGKDATA